jgi:L-lactate dehydrogenase complex protein LldG
VSAAREEVLRRIRTALTAGSPAGDDKTRAEEPGGAGDAHPAGPGIAADDTHQDHAGIATSVDGSGADGADATSEASGAAGIGATGHADRYGYRATADLDAAALLDRLADRLIDYKCSVRRCSPSDLTATIAAAIAERGARRVILPPDLDLELPDPLDVAAGSEWMVDDGTLTAYALDTFDAVITTATVAIAETGTIVLDGSPGQGRRALTLIPDYHLCVLYAHQVVGLVPEAIPLLTPNRPLTWISGPSATSDIELDRVEGVHGPRTLEVILVNNV